MSMYALRGTSAPPSLSSPCVTGACSVAPTQGTFSALACSTLTTSPAATAGRAGTPHPVAQAERARARARDPCTRGATNARRCSRYRVELNCPVRRSVPTRRGQSGRTPACRVGLVAGAPPPPVPQRAALRYGVCHEPLPPVMHSDAPIVLSPVRAGPPLLACLAACWRACAPHHSMNAVWSVNLSVSTSHQVALARTAARAAARSHLARLVSSRALAHPDLWDAMVA